MTKAKHVPFPEEVWLGITRGQWPVEAFVVESHALVWATNDFRERYVIGPVAIDPEMIARKATTIPESRVWVE